jgi:FkbM family methyltransferase
MTMQATPRLLETTVRPEGHWIGRGLKAVFFERRLPWRVSRLKDRLCNSVGLRYKTTPIDGLKIRVRRLTCDESFIRHVFVNRDYSQPGFEIHEDDVIIDIGANIGTFSLDAARRAKRGRVIAIEPNSENHALLETNIGRNRAGNITAVHAAVSATSGRVKLFCASQGGFHSLIEGQPDDPNGRHELVEGLTLQQIFETYDIARCDFLKLDCEGAEYDILFGLPEEYYRRISKIVMEYHGPNDRDERQARADALVSHLQRVGFLIVEYSEFVGFRCGFIRAKRPQ